MWSDRVHVGQTAEKRMEKKYLPLRDVQKLEYDILCRTVDFLEQNGLNYILAGGTMLGAVRHNGFIPWDDDIDILVPRDDFEKLRALVRKNPGAVEGISFELPGMEKAFYPFIKAVNRAYVCEDIRIIDDHPVCVWIDIFPLDVWSGGKGQAFRCGLWRRGLSAAVKERFETPKSGWRRAVLYGIWRLSRALGVPFFLRMINWEVSRGRKLPKPAYLGSVAWSLYGMREYIPAECFDETVTVSFEGGDYPAPAGYDAYLRSMYGDYRLDPPPEKQVTHHFFRVWKKENNV